MGKERKMTCEASFFVGEANIIILANVKIANVNVLERHFSRLWTECQNCAKTMHDKVSCAARDCPIFYMREKGDFVLIGASTLTVIAYFLEVRSLLQNDLMLV
ncbi:zf-C4pol domain-containing protein [Trichostrongylus colubriformis]|uniref:Zf-C4pol domain-containing protein n=1 Tax=Trichostrongylus colubriformis TaxID=6319 RepID=A0AAN8FJ20_TRICO